MPTSTTEAYQVYVDDNFHYMDESERYLAGTYSTRIEAEMHCRCIVNACLEDYLEPGMTPAELYQRYVMFGEDPFILPDDDGQFSAWGYARRRCEAICERDSPVTLPGELRRRRPE